MPAAITTRSASNSGVPGLKDVPGIGALFRSQGRDSSRSELIVLLSAKIITDTRKQVISIPIIALTVRENEALANADTARAPSAKGAPTKQVGKKDVEGVFVVGTDNKVTFKPVKVGIAGEKHFEVLSGLKVGDKIVGGTYQAIRELKDGTLVRETKQPDKKPGVTKP